MIRNGPELGTIWEQLPRPTSTPSGGGHHPSRDTTSKTRTPHAPGAPATAALLAGNPFQFPRMTGPWSGLTSRCPVPPSPSVAEQAERADAEQCEGRGFGDWSNIALAHIVETIVRLNYGTDISDADRCNPFRCDKTTIDHITNAHRLAKLSAIPASHGELKDW
jgi:hypothetical protein